MSDIGCNHMAPRFHSQVYMQEKWKHVHANPYRQMFIVTFHIHNNRHQKTIQTLTSWWMQRNTVYPDNIIVFASKNEWTANTWYNMDEPQIPYAYGEQPDAKGHKFHYCNHMKYPAWVNQLRQTVDQCLPWARERGNGKSPLMGEWLLFKNLLKVFL